MSKKVQSIKKTHRYPPKCWTWPHSIALPMSPTHRCRARTPSSDEDEPLIYPYRAKALTLVIPLSAMPSGSSKAYSSRKSATPVPRLQPKSMKPSMNIVSTPSPPLPPSSHSPPPSSHSPPHSYSLLDYYHSPSPSPTPRCRLATLGRLDIVLPDTISLQISLRNGEPLTHRRTRKNWPDITIWRFRWDEDYLSSLVAKARRRTTLPALKDFEWPSSETLYVKPTHNTSQQNLLRLDPQDYERKLKRAWTTDARRLRDADEVIVEVFAYLTDAQARPGRQDQIRRSSQHGIQEGHHLIESAIDQGHLPKLGAMTTAYLARHLFKKVQPTTTDQIEVPQSVTFRQLQYLDSETEALNQRTSVQHKEQQTTSSPLIVQSTSKHRSYDKRLVFLISI